jgi:hypothetical protein
MANRQAFGQRINPQAQPGPTPMRTETVAPSVAALFGGTPTESPALLAMQNACPSIDRDLEDWKHARKRQFKVPWHQLSLMASLCFGIGSFVLPDSVNDNVQWLLWGLAAISAFVWFTGRKKKKLKDSVAP